MQLLYWFEKIRLPGLNELMLAITEAGGEIAYLVIALIIFWCIEKRKGYYLLSVGFFGVVLNGFLKLIFRIPRPWVLDDKFTIVEAARPGAEGFSFPSGHSQNAVGTFGGIALTTDKKWIRIASVCLAVLVPISRMYLGVHTPWDVMTGAVLALAAVFALKPVVYAREGKNMPILFGIMAVLAVAFLIFVEVFPFPADMDAENLASGIKTAYTVLGALIAMIAVYFFDEKYLHFPLEAVWWAQILKCAVGFGLVLGVKSLLKAPLNMLMHDHPAASAVRYFLVVLVAGGLWPMSFRYFAKLGKGENGGN